MKNKNTILSPKLYLNPAIFIWSLFGTGIWIRYTYLLAMENGFKLLDFHGWIVYIIPFTIMILYDIFYIQNWPFDWPKRGKKAK